MANRLESALILAQRGFKVFPVKAHAKTPPLLADWPHKATCDRDILGVLWGKWPDANVAIHCEGLLVIDADVKNEGLHSLKLLDLTYGLPETLTTVTPTGGRHLFYRLPEGHSGVSNTVGSLGRGLDIRSTGGYVIAPGSEVAAGNYSFEADVGIQPAPEWLIDKLGVSAPDKPTEKETVNDAPEELVERARQWLCGQTPAIEGQGGDAHTFKVAAGLRDMGVSEDQALDLLLTVWNPTCAPPWQAKDLSIKVGNAYRYAANEPGARAALPDDFPLLDTPAGPQAPATQDLALSGKGGEPPVGPAATPERTNTVHAERLLAFAAREEQGPGYLIKGLLQRRSYAEMFGAPGEGKTFIALDMAYHVAAGIPWMGAKAHAGPVLYLAYEGTGGLVKRAQALLHQYGRADVPLYVHTASYNLREMPGRQALGGVIAALPAKPVLIVIDTFARALMGGDENSAQDMGALNDAVGALIASTGACVLLIHHSGKNKAAGARGSSALQGAIDTELEIDRHTIISSKQRDVEMGAPIGFKLVPVEVGTDSDGDPQTSCVVFPDAVATRPAQQIKGAAKNVWDVLCLKRPNNNPITQQEWMEASMEFLGNSPSKRMSELRIKLQRMQLIDVTEDGMITRRMT